MPLLKEYSAGGNLPKCDSALLLHTDQFADQQLQDKSSHFSELPYELLEHIAS
jgi:hypothetical protein